MQARERVRWGGAVCEGEWGLTRFRRESGPENGFGHK